METILGVGVRLAGNMRDENNWVQFMHAKLLVADGTVVTGSWNWVAKANHDECAFFINDSALADQCAAECQKLFESAEYRPWEKDDWLMGDYSRALEVTLKGLDFMCMSCNEIRSLLRFAGTTDGSIGERPICTSCAKPPIDKQLRRPGEGLTT
ncbi:MAG: hypothetical protein HYY16_19595 [Planctomycetes bacterium]|nr:hypothetical protein [Planctomycetota bacterium]